MKLRSHLLILALATVVPIAALAMVLAGVLADRQRDTLREGAENWARSMLTAVDTELRGTMRTLQALAASWTLESGDLATFHVEATRVLRTQPGWTSLHVASPDGQQLSNAMRPFGSALPRVTEMRSLSQAVETKASAVGNLVVGAVSGKWDVAVRVPVLRDGEVRYVLSAIVNPAAFEGIFGQQPLPEGWVVTLVDRDKRIIARSPRVEAGHPALPDFAAALERSPDGWHRGRNLEGVETYTAYTTSALSGWTLGVPVPAALVDGPVWRTAVLLGFGVLAAMLLAAGLALWLSRRIATPMAALAAAARGVQGGKVTVPESAGRVAELREVGHALAEAADAVHANQAMQAAAHSELADANRAKDQFLAMLSHELRNPLAPILMGAQLLRVKEKKGFVADTAAMIERQARQMSRLIEDLLNLTGITLGKVTLARQPVDLGRVISHLIDEWRAAGRLDKHRIVVESGSLWVEGDPARLEQVLANLLHNSIKYTPPGGEIALRTRREGGDAVVEVRDSGRGFSAALGERLFDVFVQGHQSVHRPEGGMGIGLALVKRLVALHGGSVSAFSAGPERGASFTVRLPAIAAPAEQPPALVPERRAPSPRRKILVVEDNPDARRMLGVALKQAGHEVHEASDGVSAIETGTAVKPEIALVDIGLPGVDGYEVARALKSTHGGRRPVLIAITGYGQPDDKHRASEAGFDAHITKPIDHERLERLIHEAGRRDRVL